MASTAASPRTRRPKNRHQKGRRRKTLRHSSFTALRNSLTRNSLTRNSLTRNSLTQGRPIRGPTVALLFLTQTDHLHPALWAKYLSGHSHQFRVYAHPSCRPVHLTGKHQGWKAKLFPCTQGMIPKTSFLHGHIVSPRAPSRWGYLVLVYYALLRAAYKDYRNQHFVFLSESCVPFVGPDKAYRTLTAQSTVSYVDRPHPHDDAKRYRSALRTTGILPSHFFKHSGWFSVCRRDAGRLLAHPKAFQALHKVKAGDEHILSILNLPACGHGKSLRDRVITYADWSGRDEGLAHCAATNTPGFWEAIDNEPDSEKQRVLRKQIADWKSAAMHPRTFMTITPADIARFRASKCLFVRKIDSSVKEDIAREWNSS